jgi:hypothetical protein
MVETLVERKLGHWDVQVRDVAASLFGVVAGLDSCREKVLSLLTRVREMCVHATLPEVRHGALLALAHSIHALTPPFSIDLANVVPELEAARLFRGKGGEHVRVAACVIVRKLSEAKVALVLDVDRIKPHLSGRPDSGKTCAKRHKEFLDDCLRNSSEEVQTAAAEALAVFASSYLVQLDEKVRRAIVQAYCSLLGAADQAGSYTRGASRALGALPAKLFDDQAWKESQKALTRTVMQCSDAETRKIAVGSLQVRTSVI